MAPRYSLGGSSGNVQCDRDPALKKHASAALCASWITIHKYCFPPWDPRKTQSNQYFFVRQVKGENAVADYLLSLPGPAPEPVVVALTADAVPLFPLAPSDIL